jgi:hypothetical protein
VLALSLALSVPGCAPPETGHGIRLERVVVTPRGQSLDIRVVQELSLSRPAQRALRHGVPLVVSASFEVRAVDTRGPVAMAQHDFEIRYLPLSERYQLSAGATVQTFPRLRHVIAALERMETTLPTTTLAAGDYILRTRVFLDRASLPAPMQLPAVLSGAWRHDSTWSTWPFAISA